MQALATETLPRITQGSRGQAVQYLQRLLNAYSLQFKNPANSFPDLSVDSIFGSLTKNAVEAFQEEYRQQRNLPTDPRDPSYFPVDGIVGTLTWRALGDFAYSKCRVRPAN